MSYLTPPEFVRKMVDAGESKVFMAPRDVLIRSIMAGAILAVAVAFAVNTAVQTGLPIVGALVFPVGFSILNLMGFDLVTGVFALAPLAWLDKRPGVTLAGVFKNWGLVFIGNFIGALIAAVLIAISLTQAFSMAPTDVGPCLRRRGRRAYARIPGARRRRHVHRVRQRHSLQLVCLSGRCRRAAVEICKRQGYRHVDAHYDLLRHGVRACRGEHVPVPAGHDDGR